MTPTTPTFNRKKISARRPRLCELLGFWGAPKASSNQRKKRTPSFPLRTMNEGQLWDLLEFCRKVYIYAIKACHPDRTGKVVRCGHAGFYVFSCATCLNAAWERTQKLFQRRGIAT